MDLLKNKKIAIMGAMEEEIVPLLEKFENIRTTIHGKNKYYEVDYKGTSLVIAYSKIGKVFSAITATTLIEKFNCNILLFSGVAGAINKQLKIGDLIIANKLCQHDLDITIFGHPHGYVPEGSVYTYTNDKLVKIALEVAKKNGVSVMQGTIATGDQFVSSDSKKSFIQEHFKADAIEMEGASVSCVCDNLEIPCLILRSISDTADTNSNFDFDKFLNESAQKSASFTIKILDKILN